MTINYDEKRDYLRMSVECDVTFNVIGSSEKYSGKGSDLSATGVMFSTSLNLPLDTKLDLYIHPYIETVKSLEAKAVVIRNEKLAEGYLIGVRLYDVI